MQSQKREGNTPLTDTKPRRQRTTAVIELRSGEKQVDIGSVIRLHCVSMLTANHSRRREALEAVRSGNSEENSGRGAQQDCGINHFCDGSGCRICATVTAFLTS